MATPENPLQHRMTEWLELGGISRHLLVQFSFWLCALNCHIQATYICSTLLAPINNLAIFYKLFINQVLVQSVAKNPAFS